MKFSQKAKWGGTGFFSKRGRNRKKVKSFDDESSNGSCCCHRMTRSLFLHHGEVFVFAPGKGGIKVRPDLRTFKQSRNRLRLRSTVHKVSSFSFFILPRRTRDLLVFVYFLSLKLSLGPLGYCALPSRWVLCTGSDFVWFVECV